MSKEKVNVFYIKGIVYEFLKGWADYLSLYHIEEFIFKLQESR